jgi:hypothetical protein
MHIIQSSVGTSGFMARSWNLPHGAAFNTEMMLCRISPAGRSQSSREEIMPDPEIHITTERARAGATPHIVRYVLGISLLLAVIAMIVIIGYR